MSGLFVRPPHFAGLAIDYVDAPACNALDSFQAVVFGRVCDPASHVLGCYGTAIKNSGHQLNIDATICLSVAQDQKGLRGGPAASPEPAVRQHDLPLTDLSTIDPIDEQGELRVLTFPEAGAGADANPESEAARADIRRLLERAIDDLP